MTVDSGFLRDVQQQATPGPWRLGWGPQVAECIIAAGRRKVFHADGLSDADARHIATFDPQVVGALLDVAEAAGSVNEFLSDGHACLDCGYGPRHRDDCVFVRIRSALDRLGEVLS